MGTCQYVAPEQILADRDLDHRVDVYSLGCVLYECLAGDPPFMRPREEQVLYAHIQDPPPKLSQVRPDLPAEVDAVLDRALAKKPEERYDSCGELMAAARAVLPVDAAEEPPPPPVPASTDCLRLRVTAGNAEGSEIQVRDEFVIGRQASEEGQLGQDAEISRQHARIARSNGTFTIEDLGSTNGTFVERPADLEARSCSRPATGSRWAPPRSWCRSASRPRRPPPLRTRTRRSSSRHDHAAGAAHGGRPRRRCRSI